MFLLDMHDAIGFIRLEKAHHQGQVQLHASKKKLISKLCTIYSITKKIILHTHNLKLVPAK